MAVPIDDRKETLGQFCNLLRDERGIERTYHTIRNWAKFGVRSRNGGGPIKLRTVHVGGTPHTCLRWYDEFEVAIEKDRREA